MKLDIMGLQFDNVTMDEAAARAEQILSLIHISEPTRP